MKKILFLLSSVILSLSVTSQKTNISGIVNSYTGVNAISGNSITVVSSSDFSVGDKVLIIQMKGATIDESNTSSFGVVTNLNNAGNYEFTTVCSVLNDTTISVYSLQRLYDVEGIIQLVRVPVYNDAVITGVLTAGAWNGSTGGILAIECKGNLTFNDNVDLQGLGFRGGVTTVSSYSCVWFVNVVDYYYNIASGEGAKKGEGIAKYILGKTGGRGMQANGGGGANDHNGGGGGGANWGAGGLGGERIKPSTFSCQSIAPGVGGGSNLSSNSINKVFLGGGGGAGHENNVGSSTPGSNGGGLVFIKANVISGNGKSVKAQGEVVFGNSGDGAGGGGAGGTVLLSANSFVGNLIINTAGSDGGSVSNVGNSNCNGPGGGGGGGLLWVAQGTLPMNIVLINNGGAAGVTLNTTQSNCVLGGNNSASAGVQGGVLTGLSLMENVCSPIIVSKLASICASDSVFLGGEWQTVAGLYRDTIFSVCCDTIVETTLSVIAVDVSTVVTGVTISANAIGVNYQWIDCATMQMLPGEINSSFSPKYTGSFAVIITANGCLDTSECMFVSITNLNDNYFFDEVAIYPNPSHGSIYMDFGVLKDISVSIRSITGRLVYTKDHILKSFNVVDLDVESGVYFVEIKLKDRVRKYKLLLY